jgi:pimeloyl-ACP methyl ester carboxylesterase
VLEVARATGPFAAVVGHSLGASATLLALRDGLPARCAVLIAPPYEARPFLEGLGRYMGLSRARVTGAMRRIERGVGAVGGRGTDQAALRVRAPGLVLHDRADRHVPFAHGVAVAAAWPGARFVPLDGLGHRRALDAPSVHQELLTFIHQSLADQARGGTTYAPALIPARETSP